MLFLFLQGLSLPPDSKFFKLRHAWVYEIGLSHMLQLEVLQKACALIWPCTQIFTPLIAVESSREVLGRAGKRQCVVPRIFCILACMSL
jgi:hypothetical protein